MNILKLLLRNYIFLIAVVSCTTDGQDIQIYEPEPPPTPRFTLSVTAGDGGTVSTSGGAYDEGTSVTITATPNTGYNFTGWSGNATGTNTSLTITINGNTSITANFEIITYTLNVSAGTGGTVSSTGGTYNYGTQVTISATPNTGYSFSSWSDGSTDQNRTITVSESLTLTANFVQNTANFTISVEAGNGGSVSTSGGVYDEGTQLTITATPNTGYNFLNWSDGSTEQIRTITVSENLILTANFEIITYTLTVNTGSGGTVSSTGGTYNHGAQVTISATPNTGYSFSSWSDGSTDQNRTVTMTESLTLTANFAISSYILTVNAGSGGTVSSTGGTYNYGAQVTISATPNTGYSFSSWSDGSSGQSITITITQNLVLTANFTQNTTSTGGSTSGSTSSGGGSTSGSTSSGSNLCGGSPNGVSSSGAITCTFTISVASGGGGTTSPSPGTYTYNKDNLVNYSATPDEGYQFVRWTGSISSMSSSGTATMTTNHVITAVFELIPAITLDSNGVTVKAASGKAIGYQETLNGDVYTIVDRETLIQKVNAGEDVSKLVTSYITNMFQIFRDKSSFNQDISSWDVSNVTNMGEMFYEANSFNQNIGSWNLRYVTNTKHMFFEATSFNQDISSWNVNSVVDYTFMFRKATSFNQDISSWNVGNSGEEMGHMFFDASSFNQDLSGWDVESITGCRFFAEGATSWILPKPNFTNCNPN